MPHLEALITAYQSGLVDPECIIPLDEARRRLTTASSATARGRCLSAVAIALVQQTITIADAALLPTASGTQAHLSAYERM